MEELFANNPELLFDLNLPFDTNLPEIATFGFQEIDRTDSSNVSLENLKRKAPLFSEELRSRKRCKSGACLFNLQIRYSYLLVFVAALNNNNVTH